MAVVLDVRARFSISAYFFKFKDILEFLKQNHLLAENDEVTYEAYVSEQNLLMDDSEEPIKHPLINEIFSGKRGSGYFKPSN